MQTETKRRILVITGDFVESTGTISFKFMIDCKYPRPHDMPHAWGYVWPDDDGHQINVFKGGQGIQMGGGWSEDSDDEWEKEMLDSVPSCTLLMSTDTLDWWKSLCAKHDVEFEHHHFDGGLKTG